MRIRWDNVKHAAYHAVVWHLTELHHFDKKLTSNASSTQAASAQDAGSPPSQPSNEEFRDMMRRVAGELYRQFYRLDRNNSVPPESVTQWDALVKVQSAVPSQPLQFQDAPVFQRLGQDNRQVTALGYKKSLDDNKSRIQFVGKPNAQSQGLPLFTKICSRLQHDAIGFWKVMHPQLGCTGPDSAVFYLKYPLEHATVQDFVKRLNTELQSDGADLPAAPLGQVHIGTGLYGTNLPTIAQQTNILGISHKDCDSAGTVICSILSQAGQMTALSLDRSKSYVSSDYKDLVKANMVNLLGRLGWELI